MMQMARQSEVDREQDLWIASREYITGEISIDELEEIESGYTRDFNDAMISISKQNVSSHLLAGMCRLLGLRR